MSELVTIKPADGADDQAVAGAGGGRRIRPAGPRRRSSAARSPCHRRAHPPVPRRARWPRPAARPPVEPYSPDRRLRAPRSRPRLHPGIHHRRLRTPSGRQCKISRVKELSAVVEAARDLSVHPCSQRWAHLSLCVLDAVFSIGVRYASARRVCERYAAHRGLEPRQRHPGRAVDEQPLALFVADIDAEGVEAFASASSVIGIGQAPAAASSRPKPRSCTPRHWWTRTSPHGVMQRSWSAPHGVPSSRSTCGGSQETVGTTYGWASCGCSLATSGRRIKPDRVVLEWLEGVLGRRSDPTEARRLIVNAADELGHPPRDLDHAIWTVQRERRATSGVCSRS